jgi:hypothetical protein
MTLLVARAAGGPAWLGTVGAGVGLAGFTALAVSLVVLLRERFRDTRRRESRPAV